MSFVVLMLVLCILMRSLFVASLFAGSTRTWRVLGVGLAWAAADLAIVMLAQHLAWTRAAQAFVTLLAAAREGVHW